MSDPSPTALEMSKQAWRQCGARIASTTPKQLGRLLMGLTAVVAVVWLAIASWPAMLPFVVGGVIAYTMLPLVDALDKFLPRILAALIGVLVAVGALAALAYIIVPPLVTQLVRLLEVVPGPAQIAVITTGIAEGPRFNSLPPILQTQILDLVSATLIRLNNTAGGIIPTLFTSTPGRMLVSTFSNILGLVVLPTWALAVLKDQPRAWPSVAGVLPPGMRQDARALIRIVDRSFGSFFRGQVVVGIAVGLATYAGLVLLERYAGLVTPYKLPLAVLAGALQLIPEVGPLVSVFGATILALLARGPIPALQVLLLYVAIQWMVGRLVAERFDPMSDLHPGVIVLVIVALTQLGAFWLFLAAPVAAVARDVWRYLFGRLKEPSLPAGLLPAERASYERQKAQRARRAVPVVYRKRQAL